MGDSLADDVALRQEQWRQDLCECCDHLLAALKCHRRGDYLGSRVHTIAAGVGVESMLGREPTLF